MPIGVVPVHPLSQQGSGWMTVAHPIPDALRATTGFAECKGRDAAVNRGAVGGRSGCRLENERSESVGAGARGDAERFPVDTVVPSDEVSLGVSYGEAES